MKITLTFLSFFILVGTSLHAQNWQTVPANDTNWFVVNSTPYAQDGRLRVAWLDSTKVTANGTENYFFPSLRMNSSGCVDTAGASWLGKKYTRNSSTGQENYFNLLGDTITLKTIAALNESWLVVKDTSNIDVVATIISVDELSLDGTIDSIKTIQLQAYQNNIPIAHNYNTNIILSKNHGFIRTLEWYAFPYTLTQTYGDFVQSFTSGHNRLDSSYRNKSLDESRSKYAQGNEWITVLTEDVATNGPSYVVQTIINEKVLAVVDTTIGYNVTLHQKTRVNDIGNNTSTIYDSVLVLKIDTTILIPQRLKHILPESINFEFGYSPNFFMTTNSIGVYRYTFTNSACSQKIGIEKSFDLGWTIYNNGSGCLIAGTTMIDPYYMPHLNFVKNEEIGIRTSFEMDNNFLSKNYYYHYYTSTSGCSFGLWYDIVLAADDFQLQGRIRNNREVALTWHTLNEHNVHVFQIERKLGAADFESFASVHSLGDNPLTNEYNFQDPITTQMQGKELQYRIKMIDHDGKAMYSNVIHLNTYKSNDIRVYPNPFKDYIQLDGLSIDMEYQIEITDLAGRVLHMLTTKANSNGNILIQDLQTLAAGMYILNLKNDESVLLSTKISK